MPQQPIPVCILVRVSTNRQETDRQTAELSAYAHSKGYNVLEVCRETISGSAVQEARHGLARALELAREGMVRKVLVHEVSRLARRNSIAHQFVENLEEHGVSLYWHQQAIETLLENGKSNPAAAIMFALLAEMAWNERETLIERIRSGLAEARRKRVTLGRPQGTQESSEEFLAKHKNITRHICAGQSVRNIAKITGKGTSTVQRVRLALAQREF